MCVALGESVGDFPDRSRIICDSSRSRGRQI
jgi:hypothetical protein